MPRDGTPTRGPILDGAGRLVLERGLAATSVDEVIAASRSSKGAFFHHFPTKADLGRALVARYVEADVGQLMQKMALAEAEGADRSPSPHPRHPPCRAGLSDLPIVSAGAPGMRKRWECR
jgi:AcrR family transcriptional regulator